MTLWFVDENSGVALQPTVTVDGNDWSAHVGVDGRLDLNVVEGTITVVAYDDNRSSRTWDLNATATSDYNLALLPTVLGASVQFQFYAPDQTTILADTNVTILVGDYNWYSGRLTTGATGLATFFVRTWDINYIFLIETATDTYRYFGTAVTVKIPKDEVTDAQITPYKVKVSGLAAQDYNSVSWDINAIILSDTVSYYSLEIQDVDENYFERIYTIRTTGGQATYVLQPYLVPNTELSSLLYTLDNQNGTSIENVLVVIKKSVAGVGFVTVQSILTDSSGLALVNWVQNEQYQLEFYYNGELIQEATLRPNSSIYYVYLAISTTSAGTFVVDVITASFLPDTRTLDINTDPASPEYNDANFTQTITSNLGTITAIRVQVTQGSNSKFDTTYTTNVANGATFNQIVDLNGWTRTQMINVTVTVTHAYGQQVFAASYRAPNLGIPSGTRPTDILGDIDQTGDDIGFTGRIIVIVLTIFGVMGAVMRGLGRIHAEDALAITALVLFFYTFVGWITFVQMTLVVLTGIALLGFSKYLLGSR